MKARSWKPGACALLLIALGLIALYTGPWGLSLLVPAAILVWHAALRPVI